MRIRIAGFLSVATALMLTAANASAQTTAPVKCKDGTTSAAAGKGACSGHGGVAAATTAAPTAAKADAKAAKTDAKADTKMAKTDAKADAKTAKADTKTATKTAKTEAKADTKVAKTEAKADPAKTVKCTDGTMSKGGRGACSHHGGIAKGTK